MADAAVVEVEAPEHEALVLRVEVGDAAGGAVDEHVAFELGAGHGRVAVGVAGLAVAFGVGAEHVDPIVDAVDERLLDGDLLLRGVGRVRGGDGVGRVGILLASGVD